MSSDTDWPNQGALILLVGQLNISDLDLYLNEDRIRQRYRMHNAYVMATVPSGNVIPPYLVLTLEMTLN